MNKFFVLLFFIVSLFNSNKVYYDSFLIISKNGNITYYNIIRHLCEIYTNIDESTNKILQAHKTGHINNENDKDIDTISNYDETDKKPSYFGLLKQEIKNAKYDYAEHVNYLNNESPKKYIHKLKYKLEFFDDLYIDKITDLRIQNKHSPLLHLYVFTLYSICVICPQLLLIIPGYLFKRLSFLGKFDKH
ncbi:Plasmodium exported protein, unknown function [Plasmodium sp.]|nr:Plasmodium exported protein, unknown function [Plasmodium sp.]